MFHITQLKREDVFYMCFISNRYLFRCCERTPPPKQGTNQSPCDDLARIHHGPSLWTPVVLQVCLLGMTCSDSYAADFLGAWNIMKYHEILPQEPRLTHIYLHESSNLEKIYLQRMPFTARLRFLVITIDQFGSIQMSLPENRMSIHSGQYSIQYDIKLYLIA